MGFKSHPQVSKRSVHRYVKPFDQVFFQRDYPEMY